MVVSTRDCSLQRRNQKLVEEAPAPFLTRAQTRQLHRSSKALLKEAGYTGAGTCEFLIGADGTISFLEVNTRLQVEHPVTEEVSGVDLVREQFRIARGERLGYEDPAVRGHSIEFRINGEDPGRSFMPAPGSLERFEMPTGPGVRIDSGVRVGETISGAFDSMVAKLIVTGADRRQALQRARRALSEMQIEGMPTVLPFHRKVVEDPAFAPELGSPRAQSFDVHTRWIETEFVNDIAPFNALTAHPGEGEDIAREDVVVEVNGKRVHVNVPASLAAGKLSGAPSKKRRKKRTAAASAASGDALTSPMQGTVVKVAVKDGSKVAEGELVAVLEAMKMEQPITAHKAGKLKGLKIEPGTSVKAGQTLATIAD